MNDIHEKPALFLKRNRRSGWKRDGGATGKGGRGTSLRI